MKNFSSTLIKQEASTNTFDTVLDGIQNNDRIFNTITDIGLGLKGFNNANIGIIEISNKLNKGSNYLTFEQRLDDILYYSNHSNVIYNFKDQIDVADRDIIVNNVFTTNSYNPNARYEDPFKIGSVQASVINNYKYRFSYAIPEQLESVAYIDDSKEDFGMTVLRSIHTPSLFNPYASINVIGITENIPLVHYSEPDNDLNDFSNEKYHYDGNFDPTSIDKSSYGDITISDKVDSTLLKSTVNRSDSNISDCSVYALVTESRKKNGGCLGLATYRYIDFMYCKDLGKIPNNRLITLRRFTAPVNDNIFKGAHPKSGSSKNPAKGIQDIGRLITWFDNDDNKLEDICKYNYHATWKQFEAKIDQKPTEQSDDGPLDKLANFLSPQNNLLVGSGFSGNNGLLDNLVGGTLDVFHIPHDRMSKPHYDIHLLSNYDQNRIYEPPNRVWDTHKYEGRLVFNQDITLVFRYTLRSYENINPKSAFLDLIGNIQTVTYRAGSFWGGRNEVYGPQGNSSVYNKANAWIDKAFDKLGGFWTSIVSGDFDIAQVQEWLNNAIETAGEMLQSAVNKSEQVLQDATGQNGEQGQQRVQEQVTSGLQGAMKKMQEWNSKYHWTDALKGMIKNQLGRPAMYAFNSLLTGEAVGPWHLTIGNPKNPILVMGNLILENAETQHLGPLGIDDFPTEIKVTVQLKHAKSRDSIDIQKMYTKGVGSIYHSLKLVKTQNYWYNDNAFGDLTDVFDSSPMLLRKGISNII